MALWKTRSTHGNICIICHLWNRSRTIYFRLDRDASRMEVDSMDPADVRLAHLFPSLHDVKVIIGYVPETPS